jgi:hypothetical protein
MIVQKYNYIFEYKFNYYLNIYNNKIIILNNKKTYYLKLLSYYYYKYNNNKITILTLNKNFFYYFIALILNNYSKFFIFYYFKLKLKGLGYRIRIVTKSLIKIFFNRSNYYYMHIPSTMLFKYKMRRLFFLSIDYVSLKLSIINLLLLKKYLVYRLSGLIYPRQIILMKPGKNKFR